jgi:ferredoxin/flavodoxin---NADP+ reductase
VSAAQAPYVIAIVGAGPSGIYAAEALSQQTEVPVEIAVIDRLPVPFGLVRYGVAPDHESIRSIRNTLERTLERPGVRFYGDVTLGVDLGVPELRQAVDAVIYAYGAGTDRRLGIPGEDLVGSIAAPELVAWYCGHPDLHPDHEVLGLDLDHGDLHSDHGHPAGPDRLTGRAIEELLGSSNQAVVVGVGNVALDVARVLIKPLSQLTDTDMADEVLESHARKQISEVHVLGRRGPAHTSFTTKELRELGQLPDVDVIVDPADLELDASSQAVVDRDKVAARNVGVLREWAQRSPSGAARRIQFHFWTRPVMIIGESAAGPGDEPHQRSRVSAVQVERTRIDTDGAVISAGGGVRTIDAQLVVRSVGYRGQPLPELPYDASTGRLPHDAGRVIRDHGFSPGEYVTGWIKRGPTGVIGTNKSDAAETVSSLLADIRDGTLPGRGRSGELDRLLAGRGIRPLDFAAWQRIDRAEIERGTRNGRLRTTIARRSELLAAARPPEGPAPSRNGSATSDDVQLATR